uniref:Uncharacterized protein n=1 Tax=Rousettus aegyptiacus TaxID=9407 RepID=A0A7J8DI66_ROUAE|nr:hypothetical protein HJG63_008536 [Rousettus aegyptiacus]
MAGSGRRQPVYWMKRQRGLLRPSRMHLSFLTNIWLPCTCPQTCRKVLAGKDFLHISSLPGPAFIYGCGLWLPSEPYPWQDRWQALPHPIWGLGQGATLNLSSQTTSHTKSQPQSPTLARGPG